MAGTFTETRTVNGVKHTSRDAARKASAWSQTITKTRTVDGKKLTSASLFSTRDGRDERAR